MVTIAAGTPAVNDEFMINASAYGGLGYGYNPSDGLLDVMVDSNNINSAVDPSNPGGASNPWPLMLLPNHWLNWQQDPAGFPAGTNVTQSASPFLKALYRPAPAGGANCDYTAPDYQDLLLGFQVAYPNGYVNTPLPSLHRPDLIAYFGKNCLQSQLTPAAPPVTNQPTISNYAKNWITSQGSTASSARALRCILFRPNGVDNTNFTGSNPSVTSAQPFDMINGPWDVDNDGDGVPDSVWVDLGFPVRFRADGKAYKPLFAILCVDLDGRLNLNAHGNWAQANGDQSKAPAVVQSNSKTDYLFGPASTSECQLPSGGTAPVLATNPNLQSNPVYLPRGQGYGPAEINLLPLFTVTDSNGKFQSFNYPAYQSLLGGNAALNSGAGFFGRYGEVQLPAGTVASVPSPPSSGVPNWMNLFIAQPGFGPVSQCNFPGMVSQLLYNKWFDYAFNTYPGGNGMNRIQYAGSSWDYLYDGVTDVSKYPSGDNGKGGYWPSVWGSPPDPQGCGAVAVDMAGRPVYLSMGGPLLNSPYSMDMSRGVSRATTVGPPTGNLTATSTWPADSLFGPAELERILRAFDRDAGTLPPRLAALTTTSGTLSALVPRRSGGDHRELARAHAGPGAPPGAAADGRPAGGPAAAHRRPARRPGRSTEPLGQSPAAGNARRPETQPQPSAGQLLPATAVTEWGEPHSLSL